MEERGAYVDETGRRRLLGAPPERGGVECEGARPLAQRVLLVAEHRRREEVEEAVLAGLRRVCVVEPGRRLEDEPARAAAADEVGELLDRRDAFAPAADLRAQPARGDLVERRALEIDRLVLSLGTRVDDGERPPLVLRQLRKLRRRPDETAEQPRVFALPGAPVLRERLVRRQARRREHGRVVEEPRQQGAARVVRHPAGGYTRFGPGPVQWEPANRVRSGRKQR